MMRVRRTLMSKFLTFALMTVLAAALLAVAPGSWGRAEGLVTRSITVTPSTGLTDGASISVEGVGWEVEATVSFAVCKRTLSNSGDCAVLPVAPVAVGGDGTFTYQVVVHSVLDLGGSLFSCVPAECQLLAVTPGPTGAPSFERAHIDFLTSPLLPPIPPQPNGALTIGTLFPVTGFLSSLGPAEVAAAELAVRDINAAGGVFGTEVVLEQGDSGSTGESVISEVDRLLALNADVIIGPARSAVSEIVIDQITGAGVVQFSPANTSPLFTTYDDDGLYFRTAPSDLLQGRALADAVTAQGNVSASVLFRDDFYGQNNADFFRQSFESLGGTIDEFIPYGDESNGFAPDFDAHVDRLVAAQSDAVIVMGFLNGMGTESGAILSTMHERGIGPTSTTNVWGTDGNVNLDTAVEDAWILEGMRNTYHAVDPASIPEFNTRLEAEMPAGAVTDYGANTYDAVIIAALAAEMARSENGDAIAAQINDITRGGKACTTFARCKAIIAAGRNPDYNGPGGPYEFYEAGEPSVSPFRLETYGTDGRDEGLDVYVFADVSALVAGWVVQDLLEAIEVLHADPDISKKAAKWLDKAQDKLFRALDALRETPPDVKKAHKRIDQAVKKLEEAAQA